MPEIKEKRHIIGYCPECWNQIHNGENYYECFGCRLWFCSFTCYENHCCGEIKFTEITLPWENDEELKDLIE